MKSDPRLEVLVRQLETAFDRRSWHGPNLMGAIRGLDAASAIRGPEGRKTPWEQVLHAGYWKHVIVGKLTGERVPFGRRPANWPRRPAVADAAQWKADVGLLKETQRRLLAAVKGMMPRELTEKTVWLIQGAAAHDLYHAGQIKLLRRMAGS